MSYYPTFAFFDEMPSIAALADAMSAALGGELDELAVELPGSDGAARMERDPDRAHRLMADNEEGVERFALASSLHCIWFWLVQKRFVAIDFGDFDSELYDEGLTDAMQQEKRHLALALHEALVGAGAVLVYTESRDDTSETYEPPLDRATRVDQAHARGDSPAVQRELKESRPWLVAVRHDSALTDGLDEWLSTELSRVRAMGEQGAVYEHRHERPLFLS